MQNFTIIEKSRDKTLDKNDLLVQKYHGKSSWLSFMYFSQTSRFIRFSWFFSFDSGNINYITGWWLFHCNYSIWKILGQAKIRLKDVGNRWKLSNCTKRASCLWICNEKFTVESIMVVLFSEKVFFLPGQYEQYCWPFGTCQVVRKSPHILSLLLVWFQSSVVHRNKRYILTRTRKIMPFRIYGP